MYDNSIATFSFCISTDLVSNGGGNFACNNFSVFDFSACSLLASCKSSCSFFSFNRACQCVNELEKNGPEMKPMQGAPLYECAKYLVVASWPPQLSRRRRESAFWPPFAPADAACRLLLSLSSRVACWLICGQPVVYIMKIRVRFKIILEKPTLLWH